MFLHLMITITLYRIVELLIMNFYQQKYFKPYHKIVKDLRPAHQSPQYQDLGQENVETYKEDRRRMDDDTNYGGFQRSPFKHIQAQKVAEPIWEHLYYEGIRSQKELLEKHNNSKNKIDIECTFRPIIKQSKRYLAASSSTFLERVNIWQEHKLQKMIREKEEEINKDLKECTFAPQINENPRRNENQQVNHNKSQLKLPLKNRNINPYYSPIKQAKERSRVASSPSKKNSKIELNYAKSMIRSELKRIAI